MTDPGPGQVATLVARFLRERGVDRVFGLQGGHIQPIWDQFARGGVPIVDVRDEGAAVHMAHAHSELTGQTGAALATAGPGVTNAITAVANASVSRIPLVLIGGCPPRPQVGMGPLQAALGVRVTFEVVDPHTLTLAEHKSRRVVDQRDHLRR